MQQLNESLLAGDLRMLVNHIFEVDSYSSKMGSDKDIVVLSFTVEEKEPALDLVNFVERGYDFVLDADATPGELNDGRYKVFVEIERNNRVSEQIIEVLDGVGKLADINGFKFRYHKSFRSLDATEDALRETVPHSKDDYDQKLRESQVNSYVDFFSRSFLETVDPDNSTLTFKKPFSGPVTMRVENFGLKKEVYESIEGHIMLESKDMAEVMFLTKYMGDYNITKVGKYFVFENDNYAVSLERV